MPTYIACTDDLGFFKQLLDAAQPHNIQLEQSPSIAETQEKIKATLFDAYLITEKLPDGPGLELIEWIRQKNPSAVILFFTQQKLDAKTFKKYKTELNINYVFERPIKNAELNVLFEYLIQSSSSGFTAKNTNISKLVIKYQQEIYLVIDQIEQRIAEVRLNPCQTTLSNLRIAIHNIAGSAAMFGYAKVTTLCKAFELIFINKIKDLDHNPLTTAWLTTLDEFFSLLKYNFQFFSFIEDEEEERRPTAPPSSDSANIYIIDPDKNFLELIARQARISDIKIITETDPNKALEALMKSEFHPKIVFSRLTFPNQTLSGLNIIDKLRTKKDSELPTFGLFIEDEDLEKRMQLIDKGIEYLLKRPIPIDRMFMILDAILKSESRNKVLIADDDVFTCNFIKTALDEIGMETHILREGSNLYTELQEYQPAILFLDYLNSGFNGLQFVQSLRSDPQFAELNIILITSTTNPEILQDLYNADADEVLLKPLNIKLLQKRTTHLLMRREILSYGQQRDHLTGLDSSKKFTDYLKNLSIFPPRIEQSLYLCLLEINHFNEIQEKFGLTVANNLVVAFANVAETSLQQSLILSYLGEGKFGVVFERLLAPELKKKIEELFLTTSKTISTMQLNNNITFNAGIAPALAPFLFLDLMKSIEDALAIAKKKGGNFVAIQQQEKLLPEQLQSTIILIDDDVNLNQMLTYTLEAHGFTVVAFRSGIEALQYFNAKEWTHPLPIIILDRLLPDMDGLEILRALKQRYASRIPVLILSALSADKDVLEGLEEGAVDYITKPFNLNLFIQKVSSLVPQT